MTRLDRISRRPGTAIGVLILLVLVYVVMYYLYPVVWVTTLSYFLPSFPFHHLIGPVWLGAILLSAYFLPAIVGRHKRNARAIFALNLLLGWSVLGWIGCLIWALLRDAPTPARGQ